MDAGPTVEVVWAHPVASPALVSLLDKAERARYETLRRPADRARYATAHALLRLVVAGITHTAAADVRLTATCPTCGGPHGRPELADPRGVDQPPIHLSLTHAGGIVAVAHTALGPLGLDVDEVSATTFPGFDDVALAAPERALLAALPEEDRGAARATWWVRKEAVLKATGHGLAIEPTGLVVSAPSEEPRVLSWEAPGRPESPVHLVDLAFGPDAAPPHRYAAAVAVLATTAPTVHITSGTDLLAAHAA